MNEKTDKIIILFVIFDLGAGGAERVLLNIIKSIDRQRYVPVLYLFSKKGALVSQVPEDVKIISFEDERIPKIYGLGYYLFFKRIRDAVKKIHPGVVLSFMWYPNAISLIVKKLLWNKLKVIVSERTSTSIYASKKDNTLRDLVIRFLYPGADGVIAPSRGIADDLVSRSVKAEKARVIHNPVDIDQIRERALEPLAHPWFDGSTPVVTAIGRLGSEKGFDYLVKSIALLCEEETACRLVIIGEGSERPKLEALIREFRLEDRVMLAGFQENPYKYLGRSTVFVLSSLYEGFPNVLLEALTLGVPAVATRCPTGPDEIITDNVNGILVPTRDERALADGIRKVVLDEALRKRLAEAGKTRSQDFHVNTIVRQYEKAFHDTYTASKNSTF